MKLIILSIISILLNSVQIFAAPAGEVDSTELPVVQWLTAFPQSQYTPHGYLDNPYHSMVLNRSGVIRSYPPLGFGYWCTNFKGAYGGGPGGAVNYLSLLNFGVAVDGKNFMTPEDFNTGGSELYSAYHTGHMTSYDWSAADYSLSIKYFLPQEHSLAAVVAMENSGDRSREIVITAVHTYELGVAKWWGSNGISARYDRTDDCSITKIWAYGDVFALGSSLRSSSHTYAGSDETIRGWMTDADAAPTDAWSAAGGGPMRSAHRYAIHLPPHSQRSFLVCLSRGRNEKWARQELQSALQSSRTALRKRLQEDDAFWKQCPVLEGDWDKQWKHGWVYDFETLRMNVRRPIGIFTHRWDAMQVHAPRSVLGETSLDMMTLSYADPETAKEVMYGTFADALAPNVPCVREDGSMNMISSDGSECGTAPMWGYPFHMMKSIYLATGDKHWIEKLYPYLRSYIEWWLEHRTDSDGWLHCNNSWESGQDGSRRFLVAEQNEAAVAEFVRTVDVEASMAEAMLVMKYFAGELNRHEDARYWETMSRQRIQHTRSMFVDNWYRDVDGRTNTPIILDNYYDVAMLAPLTCGIASDDQVRTIRPMLLRFEHGHEWPPGLFTLVEAAWCTEQRGLAAEGVAHTAARVYARTDSRSVMFYDSAFSYRVPGVANEFWPEQNIAAGGENYGWGATLPLNIIRGIIGFREKESDVGGEFYLSPALPKRFLHPGKLYTIRNLKYRQLRFDVTYEVLKSKTLRVSVRVHAQDPVRVSVRTASGRRVAGPETTAAVVSFIGENECQYIVSCE
jgi:hypothetical protein